MRSDLTINNFILQDKHLNVWYECLVILCSHERCIPYLVINLAEWTVIHVNAMSAMTESKTPTQIQL